ncbi:MAG: bifunctional phosphoribosylaminoimidazolecarboxamide formyltransferase/IMP cyclohydrolase [Planctomycetes bacterium]|nr:bifunctional phosphoribosylaminoimidazolecarboxamide formyltransferase/IMP cyclohydrolase [Planctomycetota bacterium]
MSKPPAIRRALISVFDKTGIVDFARTLHAEFDIEIISTGGTAKTLTDAGIPVTLVEDITGFPEMLDGRVKTLHPKIHAAILADRDNPEHMRQLAEQGIEPIDMVVVNLYPFKKTIAKPDCTFEEAIELIDIGGPCLLRAAAKNHKHVLVCGQPAFYSIYLEYLRAWQNEITRDDALRAGAFGAFWDTTSYDANVAEWLSHNPHDNLADVRVLRLWNWGRIRYGENSHQTAQLFDVFDKKLSLSLTAAEAGSTHQQQLSFNNYADAGAALELCAELTRAGEQLWHRFATGESRKPVDARKQTGATTPAVCCFVKHNNACGCAVGGDRLEAYRWAYLGDPNAAMGGTLAVNFEVDVPFAEAVMGTYSRWGKQAGAGGFFVEVWVAPAFDEAAVEIIRSKKKWGERVRLLEVGDMSVEPDRDEMDYKRIAGGMLVQTRDLVGLDEEQWKVVTKRQPTESEWDDLRLAWLVCKHTKSNAISICKDGRLIGNGAGQMSRVMSCRIATWLARENGHKDELPGAAAASDAFFPFRDGPQILIDAGVTALIQPGGSKRDKETIAACDEHGLAMIFTGTRHFKH